MRLIKGMNPPEFTRMTYHNMEAREFWAPKIQAAGAAASATEKLTCAEGMRKCATFHIPNIDADRAYREIMDLGLKWRRIRKVGYGSGGFSHRSHPPTDGSSNFYWFSVIGGHDDDVDQFVHAYERNNHTMMGSLLGFPDCCLRFFDQAWPKYRDPIWQQALAVGEPQPSTLYGPTEIKTHVLDVEGHPWCNASMRYNSIRAMFHLPCSPQCERTIEKGEQWFDVLRQVDENAARWTGWLLSLPHRWDVLKGYAKLVTPAFTIHAGSVECAERHIVQYRANPCFLPGEDIPGAVGGLWHPMNTEGRNLPLEVKYE